MAGDTNRYPTPADGPAGEAQMLLNLGRAIGIKNPSASWADDAKYVLEQVQTWLGTITPTAAGPTPPPIP